jgi:hypothetical protein
MMRIRGFVLFVAVSGALALPACATADRFFGMDVGDVWFYPQATQQHLLDQLAAAGLRVARFGVNWDTVEPSPGAFDWSMVDTQMTELAKAGLEPYPILDQSVSWDRVSPSDPPSVVPATSFAPADPAPFAQFAAAFAQRYGAGGAFPTAVSDPVRDFEIWNEEDSYKSYYPVDPAGYASLYVHARTAVKAIDPTATVIMGGLASLWHSDQPTFHVDSYTQSAIADIGHCPDSVGYHAYPLTPGGLIAAVRDFRAVLNGSGCAATPIDLNEFDYVGTGSPADNIEEIAAELPSSNLDVENLMPLPAVIPPSDPNPDLSTYNGLPTFITPAGALTAVGRAYSTVAESSLTPASAPTQRSSPSTGSSKPVRVKTGTTVHRNRHRLHTRRRSRRSRRSRHRRHVKKHPHRRRTAP